MTTKEKIVEQLEHLSSDAQQRVLNFLRTLTTSSQPGVPGKALLRFAGIIDHHQIQEMDRAIESECERIDLNEW